MEEEVFVNAEEEVTPRRTGRKRRSTAGSASTSSVVKKPKTRMPTRHSPKRDSPSVSTAPPASRPAAAAAAAAAGPDKDDFWIKMGGMFSGLESRMKQESDQVKEQLGLAIGTLGELDCRVERAEKRLDGLVDEVNSIVDQRLANCMRGEQEVGVLSDQVGPKSSYAAATASSLGKAMSGPSAAVSPAKRKEDSYWRCRRTLRLRPIGQGDPTKEVINFITTHLNLDEHFMEAIGPIHVQRVPFGPAAQIKNEAIVTFISTDVRDAVKGAARNLAGKGRDYGVRLELPNHHKSAMKALQAVSYELKTRYPAARRNVLFDDATMDLVLHFCLVEGGPWKRMTSAQAARRKGGKASEGRGKQALEDGELEALLDRPVTDGEADQE